MGTFLYDQSDLNGTSYSCTHGRNSCCLSRFDQELRSRWDTAVRNGLFRYKLDITKTRIIGSKGYVSQLNMPRALQKRQPKKAMGMSDPFDPQQFNFTKIKESEILMELVQERASDSSEENEINTREVDMKKKNLVIINSSPIDYGHVLILPDVACCRPQVLTQDAVQLAITTLLLSHHSGFRVGFNSQCALASVNHLHLHAYYLDRELFTESSPVTHLQGLLYELNVMPNKGFAFQLHKTTPEELSRVVYKVTSYLQDSEIAHNLFMTKGCVFGEPNGSTSRTVRIYIWPRQKHHETEFAGAFFVACAEMAGHLPIKEEESFDDLDEDDIEQGLARCSLSETDYNKIREHVIQIFKKEEKLT